VTQRRLLTSFTAAAATFLLIGSSMAATAKPVARRPQRLLSNVVAIFMHESWMFDHPYAVATWTLEDWRHFAEGLKELGYNTVMLGPDLSAIPDPLLPSDRAEMDKYRKIIDILHHEGVNALVTNDPNLIANKLARKFTYQARPYYLTTDRVNPRDAVEMSKMMASRRELLSYLKAMDDLVIIDSDPGGYPGSDDAGFVELMQQHRRMLDSIRPGIELDYWIWSGWKFESDTAAGIKRGMGTQKEFSETLDALKKLNLAPWGLVDGLQSKALIQWAGDRKTAYYTGMVKRLGFAPLAMALDYGAIEHEPSMPMTNFGNDIAYESGLRKEPRGVMGNVETPLVQLPNLFAFARGARGLPATEADYVEFAGKLVRGHGRQIVDAWKALWGTDAQAMRTQAQALRSAVSSGVSPGSLGDLIFQDANRFMTDLALQLELKAAFRDLLDAESTRSATNAALKEFTAALSAWHARTGYNGPFGGNASAQTDLPAMAVALRKLDLPKVTAVLNSISICKEAICPAGSPPNLDVWNRNKERFTANLIGAMEASLR
jgi:hypothetical protein